MSYMLIGHPLSNVLGSEDKAVKNPNAVIVFVN